MDCTNYVSQCMRAGGAPDRGSGWWYQEDNWSYSWAVAHSMRWYLSGSTSGLKGEED
ncbi:amidase domain-containing protein [Lentibacillus salicampi]|uniref:amidase domain-containing protein n=1 Tax=Lentibacillus salicampi TaxID=175306 RepID=UPI001FD7ECBA|nr:amidase domain-containing protein [Lentibacillus salicampi]